MLKKIFALVLLLLLTLPSFAINKKRFLIEKGFINMANNELLIPELIQYDKGLGSVLGIDRQNCFMIYNGNFKITELANMNKLLQKDILPGIPGNEYFSDNKTFIWSIRGRGFYAVNIDSKETRHKVISHDGDSEIRQTFLIDPEKKLFYIEVLTIGMTSDRSYTKYYVYDFIKDSVDFTSQKLRCSHYFLSNNTMFNFDFSDHQISRWYISDLKMNNKVENNLTKKLTELQIEVDGNEQINLTQRFMVGISNIPNPITDNYDMYIIHWDVAMHDVEASPLKIQIPDEYFFTGKCNISSNGNWLKTLFTPKRGGKDVTVFYHLDNKYPQGISLPVFGGTTNLENPGAFVNHTTLGPLYIEADSDHDNVLLIYKLNDCLPIIAKKFQNLGK